MMGRIDTTDHRVDAISTGNDAVGAAVQLFVREKRLAPASDEKQPVVLFVHGGTYPCVTDFDLPVDGYSWMGFLAERGFHCFAMDCSGYGYSTRIGMDDPAAAQDASLPGAFLRSPQSDWREMDAVVEFIRERTGVERVSLIGWSAGGPRAGGYAANFGAKVDRLILLAPAYLRGAADAAINQPGDKGPALRAVTRQMFEALWNNEVKRPGQYEPSIRDRLWSLLMEIDPVGASWEPQVVRSPSLTLESVHRGWNKTAAAKITAPSLLIAMEWDVHVSPGTVGELFEDLIVADKVFATVAGTSHYLPWELDRSLLHHLSASWLADGTAGGLSRGTLSIDPRA